MLIDEQGNVLHENHTARHLRESVEQTPGGMAHIKAFLREPAASALHGNVEQGIPVSIADGQQEQREYIVSAAPLLSPRHTSGPLHQQQSFPDSIDNTNSTNNTDSKDSTKLPIAGAVVLWHEVTEARRLLVERRAHAETKAQRAVLQTIIDEIPGSVYLVRGKDARLVLANRAAAEVSGGELDTGATHGRISGSEWHSHLS